jgi:acetyltransferase-like isoleucine patch superfamily enzyme
MNFIKIIFLLVVSLYKSLYNFIEKRYRIIILQRMYDKCNISTTSIVDKTQLSDYAVIYDNVILCNSSVGRHSYIQKNSRIFNAAIGNFCSIASNVSIAPGLHYTSGVSAHPAFFLKNTPLKKTFADKDYFEYSKEVKIGHDVWIGENAIILDGLTIGTGAIIAAGSIVTKNVKPYSLVGGVPAEFIMYRFSTDKIEELLKSEWWNFPDSWFKLNFKSMHNISDFLLNYKLMDKNV